MPKYRVPIEFTGVMVIDEESDEIAANAAAHLMLKDMCIKHSILDFSIATGPSEESKEVILQPENVTQLFKGKQVG